MEGREPLFVSGTGVCAGVEQEREDARIARLVRGDVESGASPFRRSRDVRSRTQQRLDHFNRLLPGGGVKGGSPPFVTHMHVGTGRQQRTDRRRIALDDPPPSLPASAAMEGRAAIGVSRRHVTADGEESDHIG